MVKTVNDPGISMEDVTVMRGGHTALTEVTFSVGPGTLMGVLGPNGAGKSTLFEAIVGLLPLAKGTVKLHGSATENGGVAYVPQRDKINWQFPATVQDVVTMGRGWNVGWFRQPGRGDREMVRECLDRVGPVGQAQVSRHGAVRRGSASGSSLPVPWHRRPA